MNFFRLTLNRSMALLQQIVTSIQVFDFNFFCKCRFVVNVKLKNWTNRRQAHIEKRATKSI